MAKTRALCGPNHSWLENSILWESRRKRGLWNKLWAFLAPSSKNGNNQTATLNGWVRRRQALWTKPWLCPFQCRHHQMLTKLDSSVVGIWLQRYIHPHNPGRFEFSHITLQQGHEANGHETWRTEAWHSWVEPNWQDWTCTSWKLGFWRPLLIPACCAARTSSILAQFGLVPEEEEGPEQWKIYCHCSWRCTSIDSEYRSCASLLGPRFW